MGSTGIAARIAHAAFWILLVVGWTCDELQPNGIALFLLLWLAGLFGLPYLLSNGGAMFSSYVAVLDIALVLLIFKGDVRLS